MGNLNNYFKKSVFFAVVFTLVAIPFLASGKTYKVVITSAYTNIYKELSPASPILRTAYKNETYELENNGRKWYRVWLDSTKSGLISKTDARLDSTDNGQGMSPGGKVAVFSIIVIAGAVIALVVRYAYSGTGKKKA